MFAGKREVLMDELRSFLFVPSDSTKKLERARGLRPDAVIYDLEDAVAPDKKSEARALLKRELDNGAHPSARIFVRVNRFGSPLLDEDLEAAVRPQVHGIVLPKSSDAAEVAQVHEKMLQLEAGLGMRHGSTRLMLMLESARGVARAHELACCNSRTIALLFGGEDFSADMGITRTKAGDEIATARFLVALAARSERLQAIDGPFTDFHDNAGLLEETRRIKQIGFSGKALIHPNQIEAVHAAFAPLQEEVAWAQEVVQTFETSGAGVAVVRGKMVDEPVVNQARKILRDSTR